MLVFDAREKPENAPATSRMEAYLKGTYDANGFKEEDHPRGGEGSGKGGQFVKSNATVAKEDDLGKPSESPQGIDLHKKARNLGYLGDKKKAEEWLNSDEGKKRTKDYDDFLEIANNDDAKAKEWFNKFANLQAMWNYSDSKKDKFAKELGESSKAKNFIKRLEDTHKRRERELQNYYASHEYTGD